MNKSKRQMTNWKRYLHCTEKCQPITKNLSKGHNRQFTHTHIHIYQMYMCVSTYIYLCTRRGDKHMKIHSSIGN